MRNKSRTISFRTFADERGCLTFFEGRGWILDHSIPFAIQRVFYVYKVPEYQSRAGHAHKLCEQVIIAINGSFRLQVEDVVYVLDKPNKGVYVPSEHMVTMSHFSEDAICLVIASHNYDPEDYIESSVQ